jgi:hypothetical protein
MAIPPGGSSPNNGGLKAAGIVIGLVLLVAIFGNRDNSSSSSSSYSNTPAPISAMPVDAPAAPGRPAYEALAAPAVQRGSAHLRLATRTEGLVGARIYSENCFAALQRSFSWSRLDQCGAADMAAVPMAENASDGSSADLAYFGPETAASRYLQAVVGAGAAPEIADERLSALQALVSRRQERRKVEPAPSPDPEVLEDDETATDEPALPREAAGNTVQPAMREPAEAEDESPATR